MGNAQTTNNEQQRYDALKKLYSMNQQEMLQLKQQLQQERMNKNTRVLNNKTVQNTLQNNSTMQRQFINSLQQEQYKLKDKIKHNKYDNVNHFLNSLSVDIDEYDKKENLYTNVGTVDHFQKKTERSNVDYQYNNRVEQQQLQKHPKSGNFLTRMEFEEQEAVYESEFERQEKQRRENFRTEQRKRRDAYMAELKNFKSSVDPYKLLKLPKDYTEDQLKQAYRKLVLITHPDRPNGSNEKFQLVTKAYMTLLEEYKTKKADKQFLDLRDDAREYMHKQMRYQKKNVKMDGERFDLNTFNKIYDENRLHEPEDDGYEKWMKGNNYDTSDIKKNKLFSKKFNLNVFNSVFEKESQNMVQDMVEYKEPEAMNSGGNACATLGQDKIGNFSNSAVNPASAVGYTDYREAYTTSMLVNPNSARRQNFKDINDIKSSRSKIEKFTEKELSEIEYRKRMKEEKEEDRQYRLTQNDQRAFDNYNKVHNMMINYKR